MVTPSGSFHPFQYNNCKTIACGINKTIHKVEIMRRFRDLDYLFKVNAANLCGIRCGVNKMLRTSCVFLAPVQVKLLHNVTELFAWSTSYICNRINQ